MNSANRFAKLLIRFGAPCLIGIQCLCVAPARAGQHVLLIGGGSRPPEALERFVSEAGGTRARILIVTWATAEPGAAFDGLVRDFAAAARADQLAEAPRAPMDASARELFLKQLATSTAVFFSGGDQNRIMRELAGPGLAARLRERYRDGVVLGGTSAGTAMMSSSMMTGEPAAPVATGLGILAGALLDTHFRQREREHRMLEALRRRPELTGIGIDEGTALWLADGADATVLGAERVTTFETAGGSVQLRSYAAGGHFSLRRENRD